MVCDEVLVLYQGRIVEHGAPERRCSCRPRTRTPSALLQAVPRLQPGCAGAALAAARRAAAPTPAAGAGGCAFAAALRLCATPRCRVERPPLRALAPGHSAACHVAEQVAAAPGADDAGMAQNALTTQPLDPGVDR